ncbi:MAG: hypothetical protein RPR91_10655, partial [Colwellia sp.]
AGSSYLKWAVTQLVLQPHTMVAVLSSNQAAATIPLWWLSYQATIKPLSSHYQAKLIGGFLKIATMVAALLSKL